MDVYGATLVCNSNNAEYNGSDGALDIPFDLVQMVTYNLVVNLAQLILNILWLCKCHNELFGSHSVNCIVGRAIDTYTSALLTRSCL